MARTERQTLTVKPWPTLMKGKLYKGRVREVCIDRKRKVLDVIIANLEPSQAGRLHEFSFQLPVRPGNPASLFLTACGKDASEPGDSVSVSDIAGIAVGMRFHGTPATDMGSVAFERIPQVDDSASRATDEAKQPFSHNAHSLPYRKDTP